MNDMNTLVKIWINLLKRNKLEDLIGTNYKFLYNIIDRYNNITENPETFPVILEMPLLGDPYIDCTAAFGNVTFSNNKYSVLNKFIQHINETDNHGLIYLESDSNIEKDTPAIFMESVNMLNIPDIMNNMVSLISNEHQYKSIEKLFNECNNILYPAVIGKMDSRKEDNIRIIMTTKNIDKAIKYFASKGLGIPDVYRNLLVLLEKHKHSFQIGFEIRKDGSISNSINYEIMINYTKKEHLNTIFDNSPIRDFIKQIIKDGICDERIYSIPRAVFNYTIADNKTIFSNLNHLKLKWVDGKLLPAKVYIIMHLGGKYNNDKR